MDDTNLYIMMADLVSPPGYELSVTETPPLKSGLIFQLQAPAPKRRDLGLRQRFELVPQRSSGMAVNGGPSGALARRLVTDEVVGDEIVIEAVADQSADPVRAVGRVTAWFDGKVRYCTGTVVAERVMLTAAHCVYSRTGSLGQTARFADWVSFEPGYRNGASTGRWTGQRAYIQKGWADPREGTNAGPFDYAFVQLDKPIARKTGIAPLMTNSDPEGPFTALGYPRMPRADRDFDGRFLMASTGVRLENAEPGTLKARNGLTEGSSGGPWFVETKAGLSVVGLNSTKPLEGDDETWSPRLGESFERLLALVLADMTGS